GKHVGMIGYLPEERGLYKKMKVGEQAMYLARLKGMSKAEAKRRLTEWFERLEIGDWWNKKVEELSKGMAQKIQFVTTVLHEPKLLILDEPFSGFDPINTEIIRSEILRLRDEGATVILSTHNMGSVEEICDRIALINKSEKILEGGVSELRESKAGKRYNMTYQGSPIAFANALWTNYDLVKQVKVGESNIAEVHIQGEAELNDLLRSVIDHVELSNVERIIPSMNDIFIEEVGLKNLSHDE
ncbi:MAG: ABC transporter ATP-binding protein, partial [Flavobacteriales bacterium]